MLPQHAAFAQALGAGSQHVLFANLFKEGVFSQNGGDRKRTEHAGRDRQGDVPQVVGDLGAPTQRLPVARGQAAQRKPLQLPAKHHQQRHAQHKAGDRVAHQHQQAGPGVKAGARTHRLGDAQWHRDQIAQQKRPQPQADRHRQLLANQFPHGFGVEKTAAQVEAGELAQHLHKALGRGFVKAVKRADFFDALGVHALAAPVARATGGSALTAAVAALQLRDHLLHRTAGYELDHRKGNQQHAKQRGHHEQQAFDDVAQHAQGSPRKLAGVAHQTDWIQLSGW